MNKACAPRTLSSTGLEIAAPPFCSKKSHDTLFLRYLDASQKKSKKKLAFVVVL